MSTLAAIDIRVILSMPMSISTHHELHYLDVRHDAFLNVWMEIS